MMIRPRTPRHLVLDLACRASATNSTCPIQTATTPPTNSPTASANDASGQVAAPRHLDQAPRIERLFRHATAQAPRVQMIPSAPSDVDETRPPAPPTLAVRTTPQWRRPPISCPPQAVRKPKAQCLSRIARQSQEPKHGWLVGRKNDQFSWCD